MGEAAEIAKDMIAGTLGGVMGIIAGQPLDTIKVRQQTAAQGAGSAAGLSMLATGRALMAEGGARALFKGMAAPIVGNAPINAVVFATYGIGIRNVQLRYGEEVELSPHVHFVAGALSGAAQSVIAGPMELVKIQLQVSAVKRKPFAHLRHMVAEAGPWRGAFHGIGMTIARDSLAFGVYFSTYTSIKKLIPGAEEGKMLPALLAGGVAGTASWLLTHPVDVMKSCVQSVSPAAPHAERRFAAVLRANLDAQGPRFLLQGLGASITRAFPVSAIVFVIYEWSFQWMNEAQDRYLEDKPPTVDSAEEF